MENWRGGDWAETQNGAHVMRRKGCAMQNKGITFTMIASKRARTSSKNHTQPFLRSFLEYFKLSCMLSVYLLSLD